MTRPDTPAERRALLLHIARVHMTEARRRRHQPAFAATLRQWSANARRQAQQIDTRPRQPDMFERMK